MRQMYINKKENILKVSKKPFRILFICNNNVGVNFWRLFTFFENIKKIPNVETAIYGWDENQKDECKWEVMFSIDKKVRSELYILLKVCDIVVMGFIHNPILLGMIKMFQEGVPEVDIKPKKIFAEVDDYILDAPDYNPAFVSGLKPGNEYEKIFNEHLRISDGVITSTNFLRELYLKFNQSIWVIPNSIDFIKWDTKKHNNRRIQIGWIGGGNHYGDLELMKYIIPKVLEKYKDVEFSFVHGVPSYLRELKLDRFKQTLEWVNITQYPKFAQSFNFDIGLAPLVDNKFNRAKSNLKWLEYSAMQIPTIASNIQPYKECIKDGKTGLLVGWTVDEWVNAISKLVENERLRKQIGNNGYKEIKSKFNVLDTSKKYCNILRRIANG